MNLFDLRFAVQRVLVLERAILHKLELIGRIAAVLLSRIVLLLALRALESDLLYRTFLL